MGILLTLTPKSFPNTIINASASMKIPRAYRFDLKFKAIVHFTNKKNPKQTDGGFIIYNDHAHHNWLLPEPTNLKCIEQIELRFDYEYTIYAKSYQLCIIE